VKAPPLFEGMSERGWGVRPEAAAPHRWGVRFPVQPTDYDDGRNPRVEAPFLTSVEPTVTKSMRHTNCTVNSRRFVVQ
jgi:hypothetical protein